MGRRTVAVVFLCVATLASQSAHAIPIRWTIGSVFPDGAAWLTQGGRLTGGFTYDADTGVYSDISLQTFSFGYAGSLYTIYQPGQRDHDSEITAFVSTTGGVLGQNEINLWLPATLTNAGGEVGIFGIVEGVCVEIGPITGGVCLPTQSHTGYLGSFVTGVPIPAAAWLFGSALCVMGGLRCKAMR